MCTSTVKPVYSDWLGTVVCGLIRQVVGVLVVHIGALGYCIGGCNGEVTFIERWLLTQFLRFPVGILYWWL